MNLRQLTVTEKEICSRMIGAYPFYHLVIDALMRGEALSLIRVSDGEKRALDYAEGRHFDDPLLCCDEGFRARFGVEGISCGGILHRIHAAAENCTHFAPTLGFFKPEYLLTPYFNMHQPHQILVEGMFQYHWSLAHKRALLELHAPGRNHSVTVINRDPNVVANLRRFAPGTVFHHVPLDNWRGAHLAFEKTLEHNSPLVLMSAALGSKFIGPLISEAQGSVVLDIGQAADVWGKA